MPNRIREFRLARGWNQRELAEATHTCQALVSDLERGVRKPWVAVAQRLSKALGVPVGEIFPGESLQ